MPVSGSTYEVVSVQPDGKAWVIETHSLTHGSPFTHIYLAPAGADYNSIMLARVASINDTLAQTEFEGVVIGS